MLWIYHDEAHGWGEALEKAAKGAGIECKLFDNPRDPDKGHLFFHMHHHPQLRLNHKRQMEILAVNKDLHLIPSSVGAELFDDKLAQARRFAKYMPPTQVFYTPNPAKRYLERARYPFVSKSMEGAGMTNVRVVKSAEEAKAEVRNAFSDIGIKQRFSQYQRGYLLWQKLTDSDANMRVLCVGAQRLILARGAENSLKPIRQLGAVETEALFWADKFFKDNGIEWGAVDITRDKHTHQWLLLEFTVAWTMNNYYECAFIAPAPKSVSNIGWMVTDRLGSQIWEVFVEELQQGSFK